ncbi:hypothetical protein AVEN_197084-1 [Araneus ventricosus]|uniref:Uncharacterized protein n=1 Tax=Araneus ventricosus TaxID=182803 RepID=A0A4Y2ADZ9_ARAVE|nr:hypothetical protein AVEN_91403-1 [Araneus ventricosus]GBN70927.1 hypothetical protein AVEN_197084-1 [Araneus ventricosus]
MANAILKGNCNLLNLDDKSVDIIGIRGIKTLSPFAMPVITVARAIFRPSLWKASPNSPKELRSAIGDDVICPLSISASTDKYFAVPALITQDAVQYCYDIFTILYDIQNTGQRPRDIVQ